MDFSQYFQIFLTSLAVTETFPVLSNLSSQWLARYVKLSQCCIDRKLISHATWLRIAFFRTGNKAYWPWKVLEIHVYSTQGKTMKCMADSKKNKHRDLGSKRVIHEF